MDIQVLGAHNCESQNSKLISLVIDNALAIDAGGLSSSLSLPAQHKLKAILLTHQHYDHIRDVPTVAMNFAFQGSTINIYSTQPVYDALSTHLLNGSLYPNFLEWPQQKPAIKFTIIEPGKLEQIEGYNILPVPVNHSDLTVGYQVTSPDGKAVFYTGDTGPGLIDCWQKVLPQLLIIEVTLPNRSEEYARESGHLTPSLLKQELTSFQELKGYLPQVVLVHMSPNLEKEIEAEIAAVAKALNNSITLAYEGMQLHL
ncbi:MAG: MBL fold metallo-hydrolase [Dehalococcoidales bacterium]|nr:MBL fold metallo-hydrolase [Dehalococcoidales bacterium]